MNLAAAPSYAHLAALTDATGVFEHAEFDIPRRSHGYCVDDVARALIVAVREPDQTPGLASLTETSLRFLEAAVVPTGAAHNRMAVDGAWSDEPGIGDWWGRALWALGIASAQAESTFTRMRARHLFHRGTVADSPHLKAMAFAGLGAAAVVQARPNDLPAFAMLSRAVDAVPAADPLESGDWPWPQPRLTYANAAVAELLIAAGPLLRRPALLRRGLDLLEFLLAAETVDGHLSVTGSNGRGPGEAGPQFDQQPIEVAAMADACARAFDATGDPRWVAAVELCWGWFLGANDSGTVMVDLASGAGYDGLERAGRNENRGAESTLAALSTLQQVRRIRAAVPLAA